MCRERNVFWTYSRRKVGHKMCSLLNRMDHDVRETRQHMRWVCRKHHIMKQAVCSWPKWLRADKYILHDDHNVFRNEHQSDKKAIITISSSIVLDGFWDGWSMSTLSCRLRCKPEWKIMKLTLHSRLLSAAWSSLNLSLTDLGHSLVSVH